MAGYVIHIAVAQEYLKKHKNNENYDEFIKGSISPDLIEIKSKTHYGKSPAYTNLKNFLSKNTIDTSYKKGFFLHLITDYLFYNYYLDYFSKQYIYDDYDILNKDIINKYNVVLPDVIKNKIFFKEGILKIINFELVCRLIDEVSSMNLEEVEKQIKLDNEKWTVYKNLV